MRLLPSDPDLQTIVARIQSKDLDLQPDFQRGEVWSVAKKRKLIDSVLRNWHIPPIHVVENDESAKQEVLDGQQRLAAIRDFVNGVITVDGNATPNSDAIRALDGLRYQQLPVAWKRRFDQFTIRIIRILDYEPDEPAELFFRLNQPIGLTTAEQRNAFFGNVRDQVKELVESLGKLGDPKDVIGFSNSRMALDDVVSRLCVALENGTIAEKITSTMLADCYRRKNAFSDETVQTCKKAISTFLASSESWKTKVKLNKATLFSWLWFAANLGRVAKSESASSSIAVALSMLELSRGIIDLVKWRDFDFLGETHLSPAQVKAFVQLYSDRSSSRVADVFSVVARDVVIWIFCGSIGTQAILNGVTEYGGRFKKLSTLLSQAPPNSPQRIVELLIAEKAWGTLL